MPKLIAIDGNSLMFRAFYALPAMTTRAGEPTGAVYGFLSMLLKLLEYEPTHLAVAFDVHGPTFRHERYAEYKQGRRPTPEELVAQFPLIKQVLGQMGIAVLEGPRYEADDIIGTLARMANEQGVDALLVTGDKDALQLVSGHTHVLLTKKGITDTVEFDPQTLMERYGLLPAQMADLKGLMGDSSDNLPGIPGVGEKTALKLLAKYGTLEGVLANTGAETGALGRKLAEPQNAESARTSYALGLIDTHAPIGLTGIQGCAFNPAAMANAAQLMQRLELRSLVNRLPAGPRPAPVQAAPALKELVVDSATGLEQLVAVLSGAKKLAVHLGETLLVAVESSKQYRIALGATLLDAGLDEATVLLALRPVIEDCSVKKLVFNGKRLMHVLARQGIVLGGLEFDAMIADYLLHAVRPAESLEALCQERGLFAGAASLFALEEEMVQQLHRQQLFKLYADVELPLITVLFEMERGGFAVDVEMLKAIGSEFSGRLAEIEERIYEHAGERFNILSTKQLAGILFEKLGLPPQKKTKSGYSTDSAVLEALEGRHPIVPLIMEYRFLAKLKSTFIDGLIALSQNGRVYTTFNQNVTATGRISSTEPNLQNIPVRTSQGREIRKAFVASPGNVLVGADYSQIELRLLAHISGDELMIEAFKSGGDIHARTAAEVFLVPEQQVSAEQRSAAKAVNFGIVYGISDYGLSQNLGVSRRQAADYISMYLARYTGVNRYMKESVEMGRQNGYAVTMMGRRRELAELKSSNYNTRSFGERVAMNMPIQGSAADIIKLAMVRVRSRLLEQGLKARLVLQIHDELIIDTPASEVEQVKALLAECMQNCVELKVPLVADVSAGASWFETK